MTQMVQLRNIIIPVALIAIIASVLLPLPSLLLDCLIVGNLILSIALFVTALQIGDPLKLSSLPTILLLCTLYRLCLNISTTRLILGHGNAGKTIDAFGSFVVGGDLVVGVTVFSVLTFIQFLVIAKGSERVAEVAARFALDAMPGRQMSIDADVRAGLYDMATARQKRIELQTESRFYGSLDGAMKFVKGDAIAGIVIVIINIVGGFLVGMLLNGLSFHQAMTRYTLLTVGDGLSSQIPSLLNSLSAGLVVTRVVKGDSSSLSSELWEQLIQSPTVIMFAGVCSILLGIIPKMPAIPFLGLGAVLICFALVKKKSTLVEPIAPAKIFSPKAPDLLRIISGTDHGLDIVQQSALLDEIRQELYERSGLLIQKPLFITSDQENTQSVVLCVRDVPIYSDHFDKNEGLSALKSKFLEVLLSRRVELLDDSHSRRILDFYDNEAPELVSNVVPHVVSLTQLTELLKNLARERISIRSFDLILQGIAEASTKTTNERGILEEVRISLGRIICSSASRAIGELRVLSVDPVIDFSFVKAEREKTPIDVDSVKKIISSALSRKTEIDAVLVSRGGRRLLAECFEIHGVLIPVIAHEEVCSDVQVIEVDTVTFEEEEVTKKIEKLAA